MLLLCVLLLSLAAALVICAGTGAFAALTWLWLLPVSFAGCFLFQAALIFLFILFLCSRVDQSVPQDHDDKLYRVVSHGAIHAALPLLQIHIKKKGMEKVPAQGRFLLVCNHVNNSDPIILLECFRKYQIAFISKRENADMFVIGPMMHKLQCQLINRENDREALKTIITCINILKEDKASVAVFPEGRIDDDGLLHHFKPGVFKIAQKANVPIVVCTLKNTKNVIHNLLRLKPSRVEMTVLDVIPAEELKGVNTVEIANRCHKLMADDLGPELVGD